MITPGMFRCCKTIAVINSAPDFLPTEADYTDPDLRRTIAAKGWMLWPPIHYSYAHDGHRSECPIAGSTELA